MFLVDCYRIDTLRDQEKEAFYNLLGQSQQAELAQEVSSQDLVNYDDVPVSHLLATYRFRLESIDPKSTSKSELEFLIGNMSTFKGDLIRLNIIKTNHSQRVIFTDNSYHKLIGCLSSNASN
ncbi:hypothetical protein SAMN05216167_12331 [Spirosoma endophyticum]|uniref:Uncharacterized protein n=1 Tax=Spirosoma endophyticum TaxID=662367 RepID=A0A1I2ETC2_9BACT|nr:hypothetical protein SAMN05216167_12331 [Spirosoma endophyticum]